MTLDSVFDHTKGIPDEEVHQHYCDLLYTADAILYGRITYQLMEFWKTLLENPSGDKSMDDFAVAIDRVPKIVFSRTLQSVEWESATVARGSLAEEVTALAQQEGGSIFVGSRSLIIELLNLGLIDEFQLMIYPVIEGEGLLLFENISDRIPLKLLKTKTFTGGAVTLYYEPVKKAAR